MTKKEFCKYLTDSGFTCTDYNSNNDWGFGGVRGELFVMENIRVLIGRASTRHRGTFPVLTVTIDGDRVQDTDYTTRNIGRAHKLISSFIDIKQ